MEQECIHHDGAVFAVRRIYIAGPYTADSEEQKQANIKQARDAGAELYRKGWAPFIPHSMTADFEIEYPDISYEVYIETDTEWLHLCNAILMLPGSASSKGAVSELAEAIRWGLVEYYSLEDVPNAENFEEWTAEQWYKQREIPAGFADRESRRMLRERCLP